jgi:hypothetical protein
MSIRSTQQKIPDRSEWDFKSIPNEERIACCAWEMFRESSAARALTARTKRDPLKFFRRLEKQKRVLSAWAIEYMPIWRSDSFPDNPWVKVLGPEKETALKSFHREPPTCRVARFYELQEYSKHANWLLKHGRSKRDICMSKADAELPRGRYLTIFIPRLTGREEFQRFANELSESVPKRRKKKLKPELSMWSDPDSLLRGLTLKRLKHGAKGRTWEEVRSIAANNGIAATFRHMSRLVRDVERVVQKLNTVLPPQPLDIDSVNPADESWDPDDWWLAAKGSPASLSDILTVGNPVSS